MKSVSTTTITNNQDFVRLRIFEGDLQVSEAADELARLERAQHDETRLRLKAALDENYKLKMRLPALGAH